MVPDAPRVNPDKVLPLLELYVISSESIITVPDDANDVALAKAKLVTDAFISPSSVDTNCPDCVPPH